MIELAALELEIVYLEARLVALRKRIDQIKAADPKYVARDYTPSVKKEKMADCGGSK